MSKRKIKHIYHPSYWPVWYLLGNIWLITRLPYKLQLAIGRMIGRLAMRLSKKTKRITATNIDKCLPHLSNQQRQDILKKCFESSGMGLMETAMSWWAKKGKSLAPYTLHGTENIDNALAAGNGAIFISPHLSSLEIAGCLFAETYNFAVMYNELKHPVLAHINRNHLSRHYVKIMNRENLRGVLHCLRNNIPVFYTPDIDPATRGGVFAPFFGVTANSLTATAKIAAKTKAHVIPTAYYRRHDYSGYDVHFLPPLKDFPCGDAVEDATRINQAMEELIIKEPEQYFWQYKRFKSRPPGEPDFYCD